MKVQIKELHPNPYRDMKRYPISKEKVDALVSSIKDTGFWDNTLARKANGKIQLAYGHHRLMALKKAMKPDDIVDIPVKDLSDSLMIQIMANENMDDWKTTPGVIDETVLVAKTFLESHPEEAEKYGDLKHSSNNGVRSAEHTPIGRVVICRFLHWPESRVNYSLDRLNLIESGKINKEAIDRLPTERAARDFVKAVKETKLPLHKQEAAVDRILDTKRGEKVVKDAVTDYLTPKKKEKYESEKVIEIRTYMALLSNQALEFLDELRKLARLRRELGDSSFIKNSDLDSYLTALHKEILLHFKLNENEVKSQHSSQDRKRIAG